MPNRLLALFSGILLLAACDSPSDSADGSSGDGSGYNRGGYSSGASTGNVTAGSQDDLAQNVGDRVFFGYDSSVLSYEAQQTLDRQAEWLQQYPQVNIVMEGHCDERGTRAYNLALGERRADAARSYLVSLGVSPSRITTVSYGKERPAALGSNESSWAQNRRAVTVITY
ncbi:MAG: peptidoglycan-associated lipoprotein Pal [Rickettsiales bacterium]|nr:peptidoglycan-associated lipoprotein Pal [Rickettsiales bacterium]